MKGASQSIVGPIMSQDPLTNLFPPSALAETASSDNSDSSGQRALGARHVWRVSELLSDIQYRLDSSFAFLWVEGEVSNLRRASSGHAYFSIKDDRSQIKAVLFRSQAVRMESLLKDGQHIVCLARLNLYAERGDLQLILETVEQKGEGALRLAFERLKERLEEEGLFASEHKRPLPLIPQRVFVITSPTGAALRDFIRTARGRYPGASIVLCPSRVQGDGAPSEIIAALKTACKEARQGDAILLTRGGGSLEDLWAFNDEDLARQIFTCPFPVVSAVGHEIDFSISDFVADQRAATPTAAAQVLFPGREDLLEKIASLTRQVARAGRQRLERALKKTPLLTYRLRDPGRYVVEQRLRHDELHTRLLRIMNARLGALRHRYLAIQQRLAVRDPGRQLVMGKRNCSVLIRRLIQACAVSLERRRSRLSLLSGELDAVSPLSILSRGYSLVYRLSDGRLVRRAGEVSRDEQLLVLPREGAIVCRVLSNEGDRGRIFRKED
jgi:exodeoxyribonuclease VII large subunit